MVTKNKEKEFKIEVIASFLENKLLKTNEYCVNERDLYELASFISGLYIDKNNFYSLGGRIKNLLLELQPELNIRITKGNDDLFPLYDVDMRAIISTYKNTFGDNYTVKSITKCFVKSLENQKK